MIDINLKEMYPGVKKRFSIYWESYGGTKSLVKSPYLHFAFFFAILASIFHVQKEAVSWIELSINILPDLLGFSLGGYAILMAFGDKEFMQAMKGRDSDGRPSPFMEMNGAFVHFIVLQATTLLYGLLCKIFGFSWWIFDFLGYLLLVYSLLSLVAATMAILAFANWFDQS